MSAEDRCDLARDPRVACGGRVQAAVGMLELPVPGQRVHDDHVRVGVPGRRHDRAVRPVERGRDRPGRRREDGEQRDPRTRCLHPDQVDRSQDLAALDSRGHAPVVVAGLHDHQRGRQLGQSLRLEHPRHRAEAVGACPDVADPGNPVDDSVPAQLLGDVGGPGERGVIRPNPGRVRRADDRHRADVARPALDPLLAHVERTADGEHPDLVDPHSMAAPTRISPRPGSPRWPRRCHRRLGSGGSRLGG